MALTNKSTALNLNFGADKVAYKLHPVVVFSILDHYKRRGASQVRVVGTLMGERKGDNLVYIKNCFPVPHHENGDMVAVDMDYHNNMLNLHHKVNPNEIVVGWYSTGAKVSYISSLMHEVYKNECLKTNVGEPVHLTVDVGLTDHRLACKAYLGRTIAVNERGVVARFDPAQLDIEASEPERIGVDALINGNPDEGGLDAPATILSDVESLDTSLNKLLETIETVGSYVNEVQKASEEGKSAGDPRIGRAIADALAAIPNVDSKTFEKMFSSNIQDLLMVVYLSNLTKAQLALAIKINSLLT